MLIVGVGTAVTQQAVGIDAIQYYLMDVLEESGIQSEKARLAVLMMLGVIKLLFIMVGGHFFDKRGRRPLFFISLAGKFDGKRTWVTQAARLLIVVFVRYDRCTGLGCSQLPRGQEHGYCMDDWWASIVYGILQHWYGTWSVADSIGDFCYQYSCQSHVHGNILQPYHRYPHGVYLLVGRQRHWLG